MCRLSTRSTNSAFCVVSEEARLKDMRRYGFPARRVTVNSRNWEGRHGHPRPHITGVVSTMGTEKDGDMCSRWGRRREPLLAAVLASGCRAEGAVARPTQAGRVTCECEPCRHAEDGRRNGALRLISLHECTPVFCPPFPSLKAKRAPGSLSQA